MTKPKWAKVESELHNDGAAIVYALEMRKALLESNKFPALKPHLEQEIAVLQKRFDEIVPLYRMAQKWAAEERTKADGAKTTAQAGKAPETPANGQ